MYIKRIIILILIIGIIAAAGCSNNDESSNPVDNGNESVEQLYSIPPHLLELEYELDVDYSGLEELRHFGECDTLYQRVSNYEADDVVIRGFIGGPFRLWRDANNYIRLKSCRGGYIAIFGPDGELMRIATLNYIRITIDDLSDGLFILGLPLNAENEPVQMCRAFFGEAAHIQVEWTY
ncbi:MAG: hypothetical protein GY839_00355 [candidate division Zixibacteria bacterium]|nr:hypothetical protein [candidate division Zixibacteria bacterium]